MGVLFYNEVENIDEAYMAAQNAVNVNSNAKIHCRIKDNLWNGREFLLEDPDGYKLVFYVLKN
jgi:hypothetical protein